MLERFDHHVEVFGSRYQKTPPSEVFKRQCCISFDPDEEAFAYTANSKYVGADRIMWASDYPHPDAKIPGVVRELEEATEKLVRRAAPAHLRGQRRPALRTAMTVDAGSTGSEPRRRVTQQTRPRARAWRDLSSPVPGS